MHTHDLSKLNPKLSDDHKSVTLSALCDLCYETIDDIETTSDFETEVITKPTSTEPGKMSVTARFKMDGVGSLTFTETIEPFSEDDLNEREAAFAEIREKIIAAKRDIASGVYTSESVQALKDVINGEMRSANLQRHL